MPVCRELKCRLALDVKVRLLEVFFILAKYLGILLVGEHAPLQTLVGYGCGYVALAPLVLARGNSLK